MKKNLVNFLFGESQVDDEISALVESIEDMDIDDGGITLKVDKKPLAKALKAIGIETKGLESDPRGLSLVFSDGDAYRAAHKLLNEPDNMHKLAELGWVFSTQGDVAQVNEPAEFRMRFLEIDNIDPQNPEPNANAKVGARNGKIRDIVKKGREFATTKPDHDDDMNPVEFDDKGSEDNQKGVGKAKDGAKPEGKPKGVTKESLSEGGHKAGCKCNFCANFKGKGFAKKEKTEAPKEEPAEEMAEAQKVVDTMLQGESFAAKKNPGTPRGIMGHKSYPTMKVPKSYPDRKFAPAKGMVQPDNEVVNSQLKK